MLKNFTDSNFAAEVIAASESKPVLVDFFAQWCGSCKVMLPIIEGIAGEIGDKAIIGTVDIEEAPDTVEKYDVMSVPTFLIFKNGQIVETFMGAQPKEALISGLNKHF